MGPQPLPSGERLATSLLLSKLTTSQLRPGVTQLSKVATRTLKQAQIPIANDHEGCRFYKVDKEKQICAGGEKGKVYLTL